MTVLPWVLVGWLAGALLLCLLEERYAWEEVAALAIWPVTLPLSWLLRRWRRWRYTCRRCGRYYGDARRLRHHHASRREAGDPHG